MGSHRINVGIASLGAMLLGAALWAFRKVHADPAHHIKAHIDPTFTYGAYVMWGIAVLLLLGFFGVLDFAAWVSLFSKKTTPEPAPSPAPDPPAPILVVPAAADAESAAPVDVNAPTEAMPATPHVTKWTD